MAGDAAAKQPHFGSFEEFALHPWALFTPVTNVDVGGR